MLEGIFTALVTPFESQKVDYYSLQKLVEWQIEKGVDGFVINGTTAESPTLEADEVKKILSCVKKWVPQGFPLFLGTGTNSTRSTIEKTKEARNLEADGALVVVPYYNKPPQRGIIQHFEAVADEVKGWPILLYNVPGRTVVSMHADTVVTLSQIENIVGIKEASGDMNLAKEILRGCPKNFILTSGDDSSCMELMALGGKGVISVISHIIPEELKKISLLAKEKKEEAFSKYQMFNELNRLLGCESNPIPVKCALYQMGIIKEPEVRLPLVAMGKEYSQKLGICLSQLGVI